jgi:hypothetical protein
VSLLCGVASSLYVVQVSNLDLVTTAEAVEILGRNRFYLYRLIKSGALPVAVKAPTPTGGYLFQRADVEALRKEVAA